eukprot:12014953-Alexandrium_andersonii.AAC.1
MFPRTPATTESSSPGGASSVDGSPSPSIAARRSPVRPVGPPPAVPRHGRKRPRRGEAHAAP